MQTAKTDQTGQMAGLSLRWAHRHFVGFVMRWLICWFILHFDSYIMNIDSLNEMKAPTFKGHFFMNMYASLKVYYEFILEWAAIK